MPGEDSLTAEELPLAFEKLIEPMHLFCNNIRRRGCTIEGSSYTIVGLYLEGFDRLYRELRKFNQQTAAGPKEIPNADTSGRYPVRLPAQPNHIPDDHKRPKD